MPAQGTFRQLHRLQGQGCKAFLHGRLARQQTEQFGTLPRHIGQCVEQVEHAAAFGQQGLALPVMVTDRRAHGGIGRQRVVVQFGVAARQVKAVHGWQFTVMQWREKHQLRAQVAQQVEVGTIGERKRLVPGHANAHTGQ
ncbi:hypothetical protein D3C80_1437930 [compost metagenome]